MVAKFNSKAHLHEYIFFEPFRPRLTSQLAKSANMIKNYFPKMQYGYKKSRI
jgi:hypothetical protein